MVVYIYIYIYIMTLNKNYRMLAKMGRKTIRSARMKEFQVGEPFAKGEGASEICEPLPFPAVASGSTETVGGTTGELAGLIGRVFDSSVS